MKKFSLLLGTLSGAVAGYVFSNKKLRTDIANAKDAEAAAKVLAKHLKADGKKVGKELKDFVESDEVQKKLGSAKKFTKKKADEAKKELEKLANKGMKKAKTTAKKTQKSVKKKVKSAVKKARK